MSKPSHWIHSESSRWVREQIITDAQAARICSLYPTPTTVPWGLLLFTGFGAVVLGLGVILLLAYNWDELPKIAKLGLVFGSVAAAHGGALHLRRLDGWRPILGEAVALLGTMFFGAGIWLVAQIYNIDEHYPNGFLFWGLGALAMAWAMDSIPQALVSVVVLTIWGCTEIFAFHSAIDGSWLLIAIGVGALAWRKHSSLLLATVLASLYILILSNAGYWSNESGVFFSALAFSVGLLGTRHLLDVPMRNAGFGRVIAFFGFTGFLICAFILTFENTAEHLLKWSLPEDAAAWVWFYRWVLPVAALANWCLPLLRLFREKSTAVPREEWLCPIAIFYSLGLSLAGLSSEHELATLAFNLIVLALATAWMVRGCRDGQRRDMIIGSLILTTLVFARYFDLFDNLAARGAAFLLLGAILFAEGFYYRRLRKPEIANEGGAS